jgi:hypothetical protein
VIEYTIHALSHIPIHESQHQISKALQVGRARLISGRFDVVTRSVDLQDQHRLVAKEVGDIPAARALPAELESVQLSIAQFRPQASFAARLAAPQSPGDMCQLWRWFSKGAF